MEEASPDLDSFSGRVISRGLEGLLIQCVLNVEGKRTWDVYQKGKTSRKVWSVTIERYKDPTGRDVVGELRKRLYTPDRRKKVRP